MNYDDEEMTDLSKQIKLYKDRATFVHISLKNGRFYNCSIETIGADFIEIHDRVLGLFPIFISEIVKVEPFRGDIKR